MNLDANEVIRGLLDKIGQLSKENAMLGVQLELALKPNEEEATTEENGSE